MNCNPGTTLLLAIATLTIPLTAIASPSNVSRTLAPIPIVHAPIAQAQTEPTARQILATCIQNRADTLPNPFLDVPANHWAFKAIMTMHYCGAYRQATPSSLIERLTHPSPVQPILPVQ